MYLNCKKPIKLNVQYCVYLGWIKKKSQIAKPNAASNERRSTKWKIQIAGQEQWKLRPEMHAISTCHEENRMFPVQR